MEKGFNAFLDLSKVVALGLGALSRYVDVGEVETSFFGDKDACLSDLLNCEIGTGDDIFVYILIDMMSRYFSILSALEYLAEFS